MRLAKLPDNQQPRFEQFWRDYNTRLGKTKNPHLVIETQLDLSEIPPLETGAYNVAYNKVLFSLRYLPELPERWVIRLATDRELDNLPSFAPKREVDSKLIRWFCCELSPMRYGNLRPTYVLIAYLHNQVAAMFAVYLTATYYHQYEAADELTALFKGCATYSQALEGIESGD